MRTLSSATASVCSSIFLWTCLLIWGPDPVRAQRPSFGRCPDLPTVQNFDVEQFKGVWYEVERSFYVFEITSMCTTFNFTSKPDGNLRVLIKTVSRLTRNPSIHIGTAAPQLANPARLNYRVDSLLPSSISRMLPGAGEYSILDTDYEQYAILWSCSDLGFFHADLIWVMGRDKDLPAEVRHKIYTSLQELGFDPEILVLTNHKNCPPQF